MDICNGVNKHLTMKIMLKKEQWRQMRSSVWSYRSKTKTVKNNCDFLVLCGSFFFFYYFTGKQKCFITFNFFAWIYWLSVTEFCCFFFHLEFVVVGMSFFFYVKQWIIRKYIIFFRGFWFFIFNTFSLSFYLYFFCIFVSLLFQLPIINGCHANTSRNILTI